MSITFANMTNVRIVNYHGKSVRLFILINARIKPIKRRQPLEARCCEKGGRLMKKLVAFAVDWYLGGFLC